MSKIRLWIPQAEHFEVDEKLTEAAGFVREFCTIESSYHAYDIRVTIERINKHYLPWRYEFTKAIKTTDSGKESPVNPNDITWYKDQQAWHDYGLHYYVHHNPLYDVFTHHEVAKASNCPSREIARNCRDGLFSNARKVNNIWLISWESCSHIMSDLDILGSTHMQKQK